MDANVTSNMVVSACASGLAGLVTDALLYPLDTIGTRLQAKHGFKTSGGFTHMYKGISAVLVASVPTSSIYFSTYETMKLLLGKRLNDGSNWVLSSLIAEFAMCSVYVPMTVVHQRAQAFQGINAWSAARLTLQSEGYLGFYRGYSIIFLQGLPWSLIQIPLWEYLRVLLAGLHHQKNLNSLDSLGSSKEVSSFESGLCGAFSCVATSIISNPIDVSKTRTVLAKPGSKVLTMNPLHLMWYISVHEGFHKLYSGFIPRTLASAVGGFVFLGLYDKIRHVMMPHFKTADNF